MTPEQAKEILKRIKDRACIVESLTGEDYSLLPGEWRWDNEGELIPLIMEMCKEMK